MVLALFSCPIYGQCPPLRTRKGLISFLGGARMAYASRQIHTDGFLSAATANEWASGTCEGLGNS